MQLSSLVVRRAFLSLSVLLAFSLVSPVLAQTPPAPPPAEMEPASPLPLAPPADDTGGEEVEAEPAAVGAEGAGSPEATAPAATGGPVWVITYKPADAYLGTDGNAPIVGTVRQFTYLQVLGYQGDFARVWNPRTRGEFYVRSDTLGGVDAPPPAYITADAPPPLESVELPARTVGRAGLAFYPTPDGEAFTTTLPHNTSVYIKDSVQGTDGATWYRTLDGEYLQASSVRLPAPPPRTFSGRWIDADLRDPAMLVAYEGDRPVMASLTLKGTAAWPTPTGVFTIGRRVANEIMNSETIGIPRNAPGGYYLTNVLYTQYFTGDGSSIHYNYWSANWGYAGSHGCLGLPLAESEFLWNWATVGTPLSIHY